MPYSATMLDHFSNPRNAGELSPPAVTVTVSNPACGDIMQLSLRIAGGCIAEARFKTRGCVAAIACGSVLTTLLLNRTTEAAALIQSCEVASGVGGLPAESGHASVLAVDALKAALKAAAA